MWNGGSGYTAIADILKDSYNLDVNVDYLRKQVAKVVNYTNSIVDLDNINDNSALSNHLKERGINKDDVVSVKHWQSMGGDLRFSIVTKEKDKGK